MDLGQLLSIMGQHPWLIIAFLTIFGVLFVNGWSDAPNAISTCISTKAMRVESALIMAAIMNFLGLFTMFFISTKVAETIQEMITFNGTWGSYVLTMDQCDTALKVISTAMFSVVMFGVVASIIGIPSSETHALIGGLVGSGLGALVIGKTDVLINWSFNFWQPLGKVVYGLLISCLFGFFVGFLMTKLILLICHNMNRNHTRPFFKWAQIVSGGSLAFVHGAQDGMQFVGVSFLALQIAAMYGGITIDSNFFNASHLWYLGLACATVIGIGTLCGGKKIIKKVAMSMTKLEPYEGFATDLSSAIGIFIATCFGFPISTSQVKAFAILGAGASKGINKVKWSTVGEMVLTWVCTFPGSGLFGFLASLILLSF